MDQFFAARIWGAFGRLCATAEMAIATCAAESRTSTTFDDHLINVFRDVAPEKHEKVSAFIDTYTAMIERVIEAGRQGKTGHIETIDFSDEDDDVQSVVRLVANGMMKFRSDVDRDRYATDAAMMSITSALEVLCTELLRSLFELHPRAIPGNPTIDLETVLSLPSTQGAVAAIAEKQAVEIARGPVEGWLSSLASHCGIKLPKRTSDWPREWLSVVWMSHQRNCIIHRGGSIDSKLREKASYCGYTIPSDHTVLTLDPLEVTRFVSCTLTVASRLTIGFGDSHLAKSENSHPNWKTARTWLAHEQFEQMSRGQFAIARAICPESGTLSNEVDITDVARWYALLTTDGIDDAQREDVRVAKWTSEASYQIHRSILLDDEEEIRNLVREILDRGYLTALELRHNPEFFLAKKYLDLPDK
ncbi:hypothetical protein [Lentzea albidocapillata]|uniref:Uncharacterized protein n=1 Tax=Lentzea albidocapillata TaxID=40571 RepID=A0A1W2FAS2_9PSEU|nr:hypothetical protein [Lentzea albidocapillata]SMD19089.1 hypothetical protein SAMN05660733_05411 [Lentzea albidocapillata]